MEVEEKNMERNMEKVQSVIGVGWIKLERITIDPEVMGGQPCIRGLRIPVSLIIKLIASGKKIEDILEDYPELKEEDIKQSLEYAAWTVSEKVLPITI
ncbi:MAG: DUF433 domain-containing protein [Methanophagales archaeon]|nr:DUF433 domain-containing protein [Methanophagales archaeon]